MRPTSDAVAALLRTPPRKKNLLVPATVQRWLAQPETTLCVHRNVQLLPRHRAEVEARGYRYVSDPTTARITVVADLAQPPYDWHSIVKLLGGRLTTARFLDPVVPRVPVAASVVYCPPALFQKKLVYVSPEVTENRPVAANAIRLACNMSSSLWTLSTDYAEWRSWSRRQAALCVAIYTSDTYDNLPVPERPAGAICLSRFLRHVGRVSATHSADGITLSKAIS